MLILDGSGVAASRPGAPPARYTLGPSGWPCGHGLRTLTQDGDGESGRQASMPVIPLADPSPSGGRFAPIAICSGAFSPQNSVGGEKGRLTTSGRSLRSRLRVFPLPSPGGGDGEKRSKKGIARL